MQNIFTALILTFFGFLQATVLYLVPPLVLYLGNSPSVTKEHLSTVRTIVSGAAPTSESDIKKVIAKGSEKLNFVQGI